MRNPGPVVPISRFAFLVSAHLCDGFLVGDRIVLNWDESGHAAHRVNVAAMASADKKLAIRTEKMRSHCDSRTVRQKRLGVLGKLLDVAKNVVPPPTV